MSIGFEKLQHILEYLEDYMDAQGYSHVQERCEVDLSFHLWLILKLWASRK